MTAGLDGGGAASARDAGTPVPYWDAAHPTIHRGDGGLSFDDFDAGPVLNPVAHAACLTLLDAICNRVADCDQVVANIQDSQKATMLKSCEHTFLRERNCNRAVSTASGFEQCVASVKTIDCNEVFISDISGTCDSQLTLQP